MKIFRGTFKQKIETDILEEGLSTGAKDQFGSVQVCNTIGKEKRFDNL